MRRTLAPTINIALLFTLLAALTASDAYAAIAYRYCTQADLNGTWKMIQFSEIPPLKEDHWVSVAPYHYIAFYAEQNYSYLASLDEITAAQVLQKHMLWAEQAKIQLLYTLGTKGELNLYLNKKPLYSYRCFSITESSGPYLKNDLILTGYTLKDPTSKVFKLYRRWF